MLPEPIVTDVFYSLINTLQAYTHPSLVNTRRYSTTQYPKPRKLKGRYSTNIAW